MFDGHGKNGHTVSEMVRNRLPLLLLNLDNAASKIHAQVEQEYEFQNPCNDFTGRESEAEAVPIPDNFQKWKEDISSSFKAMDKEIKLQENLDCACSGTTAVVIIRQVIIYNRLKSQTTPIKLLQIYKSFSIS